MDNGDNVPALEFAGLVKRFGDNVAVDHVDLVLAVVASTVAIAVFGPAISARRAVAVDAASRSDW